MVRGAQRPHPGPPVAFQLAVFGVGLAAGFLNVMAGGGSLLTLPVLLFLGLPAATANGTNRVAILVQNITAVTSFRQQGYSDLRTGVPLALAALPGAILGAVVAVRIPETVFRAILAGVLIVAVIGLVLPRRRPDAPAVTARRRALAFAAMVAVGFYGGFIQAGVGFVFMLVLHNLLGLDLVRTNMHKVFIVLFYTIPALGVFVLSDNVAWVAGGVLAAGSAAGALIATRVSVRGGEGPVRWVVAVALVVMAVGLLRR